MDINMDKTAMSIVRDYIIDNFSESIVGLWTVYTVWKVKALQNWKFLISSTLNDGMYYEVTYNGDLEEWYLDAYTKFENKVIPNSEIDK